MHRLLLPSSALCWGLQFAFLTPTIAILLTEVYGASPGQVGLDLALYNGGGFLAALVIPAAADRRRDYLWPLLGCGVLTMLLAVVLAATNSLTLAVSALIILGGPAGVGVSLLFAELRHSGASQTHVINTRAIVSFAWVAGPPIAAFIMGAYGSRSILAVLGIVGALNVMTTAMLLVRRRNARMSSPSDRGSAPIYRGRGAKRSLLISMILIFVALQATNAAATSIMSLFVTARLGLPLLWAGISLGVSALLEIPALLIIGRLSQRFSSKTLIISGCLAGVGYYGAMSVLTSPALLLLVQPLNAWFVGITAGIGLTVFQDMIPRPGLASGMFTNVRKVGAIISGAVIAVAGIPGLGYGSVFAVCELITILALVSVSITRQYRSPKSGWIPTTPADEVP